MIRDYIPQYNDFDDAFRTVATSGYVIAINVRMLKPEIIEVTYPAAWWEEYRKRMYVGIDPVAYWCISQEGTKRWSEICASAPALINNIVMERARKHGVKFGASISLGSIDQEDGRSFMNVARPDREFTDDELAFLEERFRRCCELVRGRELLNANEIKALELTAQGFTQKEIAREMDRSPAYVKIQLNSARKVLRAASTTHTVALAQQRGLIDVPGGMRW